jgi:hypothetical protein
VATIESIMVGARQYLRDFPRFFAGTTATDGAQQTIKLPYPNIDPQGFRIWAVAPGGIQYDGLMTDLGVVADAEHFVYTLIVRDGLSRITDHPTNGFAESTYINFEGFYYEWLAEEDLRFFAEIMFAEHADDRFDLDMHEVSDVEEDVLCLGTAVEACWSLLAEMSRDVDISTPEAIGLPLTQRFRQLEGLTMSLQAKYKTKASLLGVGLDRIKIGQLRRQSRSTNRMVPLYQNREWDDARRPKRLFPRIDQEAPSTPPPGFTPAKVVTGFFEQEGVWVPVQEDR